MTSVVERAEQRDASAETAPPGFLVHCNDRDRWPEDVTLCGKRRAAVGEAQPGDEVCVVCLDLARQRGYPPPPGRTYDKDPDA